jgi:hypothetical protein
VVIFAVQSIFKGQQTLCLMNLDRSFDFTAATNPAALERFGRQSKLPGVISSSIFLGPQLLTESY